MERPLTLNGSSYPQTFFSSQTIQDNSLLSGCKPKLMQPAAVRNSPLSSWSLKHLHVFLQDVTLNRNLLFGVLPPQMPDASRGATSPGIPSTPQGAETWQRPQVLRDPQSRPPALQKLQAVTSPTTETVIAQKKNPTSTYCKTKPVKAPKKAPPTTHPTPLESRLNPQKRALPRVPAFLLVREISSLTWSSSRGSRGREFRRV